MAPTRRLAAIAAVAISLAVLAAHGPRLRADEPAGQGTILYTRALVGTYLTTGDDEKRVCFAQGDYVCPRLLPAGDRVVLNSHRGGRPGVWIQRVGSDDRLRVCDGEQVSVDSEGRGIVFRREGVILRRDLASGHEQVVSPEGWTSCSYPSFHPDGRVLFVSAGEGKDKLYLAAAEGGASPRLLLEAEVSSAPRCSPDGQTVAYQDGGHLCLFGLATGDSRRLTGATGVQSWPIWSRDGKSVAYLQSPSPVDGPWDLYRVVIDSPREVRFMLRDVEPAPDWNGLGFADGEPSAVPGGDVHVWASGKPMRVSPDAPQLPKPDATWESPSGDTATTTGDLLVECGWGGAYLSAATGSVFLAERRNGALSPTAEVRLLDEQGQEPGRIESIKVSPPDADDVRLEATIALKGGAPAKALLSVSRTRPFVEVRAAANLGLVRIQRPLALAVVPDRLADDLLYEPSQYAWPAVRLPRAPFVLGMPADKSGLLMVVTPSAGQTAQLLRGESAFAGFEVECGPDPVLVAALPGHDLWRTAEVKAGVLTLEGRAEQQEKAARQSANNAIRGHISVRPCRSSGRSPGCRPDYFLLCR